MNEVELEPALKERLELVREAPEVKRALERIVELERPELRYHNIKHVEDVMSEAALFCLHDELPERDSLQVLVAAAFHDSGIFFVRDEQGDAVSALQGHEERSVENLKYHLEDSNTFDFTQAELAQMSAMILDTQLLSDDTGAVVFAPPSSTTAAYLVDADLSNFGRTDFLKNMESVRLETSMTKAVFKKRTLSMLRDFEYKTAAAQALRGPILQENIRKLKRQIDLGLF